MPTPRPTINHAQRVSTPIDITRPTLEQLLGSPLSHQPTSTEPPIRKKTFELMDYNTKATKFFPFKVGKNPKYTTLLGVELELDHLSITSGKILQETLAQHAIFKRDGSVSNGVEICSAPATLDVHKEEFLKFFNEIDNTSLEAEDNCGLHIHVDRSNINQPQLAKILIFMNHANNNDFIEQLAGRSGNGYCRREDHSWQSVLHKDTGEKYTRVNIRPEATIEFRLFASTTDYSQFTRCLDFVQAIVDYTKTGATTHSIKEIHEYKNFTNYVNKNYKTYPDLHKYMNPNYIKKTNQKGVPF